MSSLRMARIVWFHCLSSAMRVFRPTYHFYSNMFAGHQSCIFLKYRTSHLFSILPGRAAWQNSIYCSAQPAEGEECCPAVAYKYGFGPHWLLPEYSGGPQFPLNVKSVMCVHSWRILACERHIWNCWSDWLGKLGLLSHIWSHFSFTQRAFLPLHECERLCQKYWITDRQDAQNNFMW